MNQPLSAPSANASRPARRSLAEFALPPAVALGTSSTVEIPMPVAESASAPQLTTSSSPAVDCGSEYVAPTPASDAQQAAARGAGQASSPEAEAVEDDALLRRFEDMTSTAAKAARDYRFWMLEQMKVNMTVALNYANGIAGMSSRTAAAAPSDTHQSGTHPHPRCVEETTSAVASAAGEYRAKALELMTRNLSTAMQYAQRLGQVNSPMELMELSADQARKQFEFAVKQSAELGSIAQRMAMPDIAAMVANFARLLGDRK